MTLTILILNIIILECILSIDNAAALATMVKHLPKEERKKALRYGMIGAYVFRGLALVLAVWLIKFSILKFLGGAYLIYLCVSFFIKKSNDEEVGNSSYLSFWGTVFVVEVMDIAFSIDNILAVVAMTPDIWAIIIGVFMGIAAMRYAAGVFSDLLEKYPELENSAYIVIGILGMKLALSFIFSILGFEYLASIFEGHTASAITSGVTLLLFIYPFIKSRICSK